MRRFTNRSRGFIKTILLVIIALVLLKYFFNLSLNDIIKSQVVQDIWSIIKSLFQTLWGLLLMILDFLKALIATAKDSLTHK
ncbi:MAG: hypothetical protein V4438_00975 [Patescibacteria group bacterium]